MTTSIHRETATVYQFPVRPRRRLDNGLTAPATMFDMAPGVVDVNCWYHEEALSAPQAETERPKPC